MILNVNKSKYKICVMYPRGWVWEDGDARREFCGWVMGSIDDEKEGNFLHGTNWFLFVPR